MKALMRGMSRLVFVLVAGATALLPAAPSAADEKNFYEGNTINIVVGFGPGGGYDLYARLLAQYLGKYIPGHPTVVVQNLAGAGGVRAANYVYSGSPKNGTVIAATNQFAPMFQLLGGKVGDYDAAKIHWLGSMASSNNVLYVWHTAGINTLDDAKQREVPLAGSGVISDANIYPAILNAMLGTKFKIVNGYEGTNESNLAVERGEVAGRGGGAYSTLVSTRQEWLRGDKVKILVQTGTDKEPDLKNVPLLTELAKTDEQRQMAAVVTMPIAIGYNYWVAPEVPAERVEILRTAFAKTLADPALLADAKKVQLDIRPKTGEALAALVKEAGAVPKPTLEKIQKILGW
jgi:tripartite-type tricarboxylate transporter receptor subunit TctC